MTTQAELTQILKKAGKLQGPLPVEPVFAREERTWLATWSHAKGYVTFDGKRWAFFADLESLAKTYPSRAAG